MSFFTALAFKNSLTGSPSQGSTAPEPEPIGVFWDIENCPVPRGKSASAVVQKIRKEFFSGKREVEFMCVCDINKEKKEVIEELNKAQVRFQIPWTCFVYVNLTRAMVRQQQQLIAGIEVAGISWYSQLSMCTFIWQTGHFISSVYIISSLIFQMPVPQNYAHSALYLCYRY